MPYRVAAKPKWLGDIAFTSIAVLLAALQLTMPAAAQAPSQNAAANRQLPQKPSVFVPDLGSFLPAPSFGSAEQPPACKPTRPMRADSQSIRIRLSGTVGGLVPWAKRHFGYNDNCTDWDYVIAKWQETVGNPATGTATSDDVRKLDEEVQKARPRIDVARQQFEAQSMAQTETQRSAHQATLSAGTEALSSPPPSTESCSQSRQNLQAVLTQARTLESDRKYAVNRRERCEAFKVAIAQNPAAHLRAQGELACNEAQALLARVNDIDSRTARFSADVRKCDATDAAVEEWERPERERVARETQAKAAQERAAEAAAATAREQESQRAYKATLARSSPQALYLLAGKFEREGNTSRAIETYDHLIEKHTESSWAVKANDRLLQLKASSETEQAQQRASRQAACIAGVPNCQDNCSIHLGYGGLQRCRQMCVTRCN